MLVSEYCTVIYFLNFVNPKYNTHTQNSGSYMVKQKYRIESIKCVNSDLLLEYFF